MDDSSTYKLAPKLAQTHLKPGKFQKMKVAMAAQVRTLLI